MVIFFVIERLDGGGKERRLVNLINGLAQSTKHDLHLVLNDKDIFFQELDDNRVVLHEVNDSNLLVSYYRLLSSLPPDIVHTWSFKTSLFFSFLKPLFSYKHVVGFIGDTYPIKGVKRQILLRLTYPLANVIISNSLLGLKSYEVPLRKGKLIYNGLSDDHSHIKSRIDLHKVYNITTKVNIIMIANVTRYKDYETFINVAQDVTRWNSDLGFIAVGKIWPEFEMMVKPYIRNKNPQIKFLGQVENISSIIEQCDIGLLCSDREGISNSILECMRGGLPVVTTDLMGGSKEILEDGYSGFICPKDELPDILKKLVKNPGLRRKIGLNARTIFLSRYSQKTMVNKYIDIINEILV